MDGRIRKLREIVGGIGPSVLAFSGGCDSTFLARVARDVLGEKLLCVTLVSPFLSGEEKQEAARLAGNLGVRHRFLKAPLPRSLSRNPRLRCYFCKKNDYSLLKRLAVKSGLAAVMEGTNADDGADYRPGMRAVREQGVRSPLLEAGLSKKEIRLLSRKLGLPTWDKPSQACLASRFPYGERFTVRKLRMVEKAEAFIRGLGIRQVRVRYHGPVARIETGKDELPKLLKNGFRISGALRQIGFKYAAADLEGYRTGSMNEAIGWKRKK